MRFPHFFWCYVMLIGSFKNILFFFSDAERHKQNLEENKNKVESSLQDKLAARRQRRAMKNVEEKEKSVLV